MIKIIKPPDEYGDRYEMGAMAGAVMSVVGIKGAVAEYTIKRGTQHGSRLLRRLSFCVLVGKPFTT